MKSLAQPDVCTLIRRRIASVRQDSPRAWGKMTPHQMLCHLSDSFLLGLGEKPASDVSTWASRNVVKRVALNLPVQWPKDIPTRPEMEQGKGGTNPGDFELDRLSLLTVIDRFLKANYDDAVHPLFGRMKPKEWLRWGYLHADHHLRQFGE